MDDYELLDAGSGGRLERFGVQVTDRPAPGALADRRDPVRWSSADLRFDRDRGWTGPGLAAARSGWTVRLHDLVLQLRPTDAGQVGCFPEHAAHLSWLEGQVAARPSPSVLHLFAYTGLATLALARAGAAVAHVDAAKPAVAWARRNAAANDLQDRPIRWLVDDARAFVARESRRSHTYEGIVLDPPTYGHGAGPNRPWRIEQDLADLIDAVARLLTPGGFVLLTTHTPSIDPDALRRALVPFGGRVEAGDLHIRAVSGVDLTLGTFARTSGA